MSILRSLIKDLLSRKPRSEQARVVKNLDISLSEQSQLDEGVAHYRKILAGKHDNTDALFNLALIDEGRGNENEAIAGFRRVIALDPRHHGAQLRLAHMLQMRCEWRGLDAMILNVRQAVHQNFSTRQEDFLSAFAFLGLPGATAAEQKLCAQRYARLEFQPPSLDAFRASLGFDFNRPRGDRIRIGYLSADFRRHPVAQLMVETFEQHDRKHFHITAYAYGRDDGSEMRRRLERTFDDFVDVREFTLEATARKIYEDRIDILVDLTGYTRDTRSAVLALRPAPIQVNFLGYPGTMGADFVDYIIADNFVIPPELEQHYSEKVMRMPDCFLPNNGGGARPAPASREEFGLPEDGVVFCCFNQPFKITQAFFDVWCRLLREVPGSVLWLSGRNAVATENLKREAAARGIGAERLVFATTFLSEEKHLARMRCADLFLDTSPYNAHTTCSEALAMGLPVVTCAGDTFASRVAGSMLTAIGAPELVSYSLDAYYQLALDLATHPDKLDVLRRKIIASRDSATWFDRARFTRNLEQCYTRMAEARTGAGGSVHS